MWPPLKRPLLTCVNADWLAITASAAACIGGAPDRPSTVPRVRSGRLASNKPGITLAIARASPRPGAPVGELGAGVRERDDEGCVARGQCVHAVLGVRIHA